jgi:hypothetical protein
MHAPASTKVEKAPGRYLEDQLGCYIIKGIDDNERQFFLLLFIYLFEKRR